MISLEIGKLTFRQKRLARAETRDLDARYCSSSTRSVVLVTLCMTVFP